MTENRFKKILFSKTFLFISFFLFFLVAFFCFSYVVVQGDFWRAIDELYLYEKAGRRKEAYNVLSYFAKSTLDFLGDYQSVLDYTKKHEESAPFLISALIITGGLFLFLCFMRVRLWIKKKFKK
jgi:Trk-type K+ transport system membrane component